MQTIILRVSSIHPDLLPLVYRSTPHHEVNKWAIYWGGNSLWITAGVNGNMIDGRMFADDSLFIGAFGTGRDKLVVYRDPYLKNNISIRANFNFKGYNGEINGMTYREAFLKGIEKNWSDTFEDYNVSTYAGTRIDGISVNIINGLGQSKHTQIGFWSYNNPGSLTMYTGSDVRRAYWDADSFGLVAAHEFGHNLGLRDVSFGGIMGPLGLDTAVNKYNISDLLNVYNTGKRQKSTRVNTIRW